VLVRLFSFFDGGSKLAKCLVNNQHTQKLGMILENKVFEKIEV